MSDLGMRIKKLLCASKTGMTAREIADTMGCTRKTINSYLYKHTNEFIKDSSYVPLWSIKGNACIKNFVETDPVMLKFQNREDAKMFTQVDFDNLAYWQYGEAHIGRFQYETQNGNVIECDSQYEIDMLEYLEENQLVQDVGGQSLLLKYDTEFRVGRNYSPDIVALTRDGHIAVIEVKAVSAMDNHTNLEKYRQLASYCETHGFMYVMIDPKSNFMTYEELRDMEVSENLLSHFEKMCKKSHTTKTPYVFFDSSDVDQWYKKFGKDMSKNDFKLQVHSLVIYYEWYNVTEHGFKVYSRPVKLKKIRENDYIVIDYI